MNTSSLIIEDSKQIQSKEIINSLMHKYDIQKSSSVNYNKEDLSY